MQLTSLITPIQTIAQGAGARILHVYNELSDDEIITKDDNSPLTQADLASQQHIVNQLNELTPDIPIMAEEGDRLDYNERKQRDQFRCVDPLDGTKEFIKKNDEFTVNIALIRDRRPVLGIIYIPVQQTGYYAYAGWGAYRYTSTDIKQIEVTDQVNDHLTVMCSRSHLNEPTEQFLATLNDQYDNVTTLLAGSSLKFCRVAEGKAHLYPRFAPTKERDTAAGQIIVTEAGGKVIQLAEHTPLQYNKQSVANPSFYASSVDIPVELLQTN